MTPTTRVYLITGTKGYKSLFFKAGNSNEMTGDKFFFSRREEVVGLNVRVSLLSLFFGTPF